MQKIIPFLWFDGKAEEATNFYTSVFKDSKVVSMRRYSGAAPGEQGKVMTTIFEINGQQFYALNGGPMFKFTPAISFFINCDTQEEIDYLWEALSAGGTADQCGWLRDQFGVSWQVVPTNLGSLLSNPDPEKAKKVMQAMLKMHKLDIKLLQQAADQ